MKFKVSSVEEAGLSPSDCVSDPEEKEISDDDDDDRNHKHRRRETRSQYLERGALEQVLTRPYRKRNKPFENGQPYRENNSLSSETWKNYNIAPLERDLSAKFENRRPGLATFPRAHMDLNQRMRANQSSSGEPGSGRGRARETGYWSQRDSRFSSVDIASQMVQQGFVPPSLFAGRGSPNVSNAQSASWSAFGLIPGIPNGGLDTLHSLGLQGSLRPPITPLNMGIPRQRCRDFEERGFCLRGDICPMEHGVNRIVVDDVQSLSQFNLPVSLSSGHLLGVPAGTEPLSTLIDSKSSKSGTADNRLGWNGSLTGSAGAGGDFYDPDQPLWTNDCTDRSTAFSALNPSKVDETESLLDADLSDCHHPRFCDGSDNKCPVRSDPTAVESQSTSKPVWERIEISKNRSEMKRKIGSSISSSNYVDNEAKEDQVPPTSIQGAAQQGKRIITEDIRPQVMDSLLKTQGDSGHNIRKPSQKALRTLFVSGIPQKDNKKDALLSHFRKFGEVMDIYIPSNSERAFVQFSKREEAEAALKAPDAVMGNRFIKLWWANRDSIPDNGMRLSNNVSVMPHGMTVVSVPPHSSITDGGKDNHQCASPKVSFVHSSVSPLPTSDHPEPAVTSGPKAPPPLQKKLESLELLKELVKKQEMLDQKRNDFRRQLDKLERQASGIKSEVAIEQATKRHKVGIVADVEKVSIQRSIDLGTAVESPVAEVMVDKNKSAGNVVHHSPKMNSVMALQQPSVLKPSVRPLAPLGAPFIYRFKLDNRPTAFKIIPPLPSGLANVAVLKEHFSTFGDLSTVELDDLDSNGSDASKNCSALISFTTRRSAERAFVDAKCWQGYNLQFMWLMSSNSSNGSLRENPLSASKGPSDGIMQPTREVASTISQEAAVSGNADVQPTREVTSTISQEAAVSGNADVQPTREVASTISQEAAVSGNADVQPTREVASTISQEAAVSGNAEAVSLGRRDSEDHMERDEDLQSCLTDMSYEKQPPKGDGC